MENFSEAFPIRLTSRDEAVNCSIHTIHLANYSSHDTFRSHWYADYASDEMVEHNYYDSEV